MLSFVPEKPHVASRILFWNVEDFGWPSLAATHDRAARITDIFKQAQANVILLAEIVHEGMEQVLLDLMPQGFAGEQFPLASRKKKWGLALTDSSAHVEKADISSVTLQLPTGNISVIPYHAMSGSKVKCFKHRQQEIQIYHDHALKASVEGPTILIGDFNTMGNGANISGALEITILRENMGGFVCLPKTQSETWMGVDNDARYPNANLDHTFISRAHIDRLASPNVFVGGWPNFSDFSEREAWVHQYSDHAFLILDIK